MTKPKLVVLTGMPAAGKSVVAERLMRDHGFVRLSTDELRLAFYGTDLTGLKKKGEEGVINNYLMWDSIERLKQAYLYSGKNVVIDSTGEDDCLRESLMKLPEEYFKEGSVEIYLVSLETTRELLEQRYKARGSPEGVIDLFNHFKSPTKEKYGDKLIVIENVPGRDLPSLYGALEKIIGQEKI